MTNAAPVQNDATGKPAFEVPMIENIHQRILEAVTTEGTLDMGDWHKCETTHCVAGWAVHLAGAPGYELEKRTSTVFAAMQIFHKSSPDIMVSPSRFYEMDNQKAMADIISRAEKEKELHA